jgi:hypothetical protein
VRRELGIDPFLEDTSRWLEGSWLGRQAAGGFGAYAREAEQAQLLRKVVEAGVSCRELYRLEPDVYRAVTGLAARGASGAEIRAAVG